MYTSHEPEMWILTLREEYKRRASENRVVMKLFGPTSGKVRGKQRKLTDKELHVRHTDHLMLN
jgi:hypothetical protein